MGSHLTLWQRLQSLFAALIGVQSDKNRQRDFKQYTPWQYVLTGIAGTLVFVVFVLLLTHWALSIAAG